MAHATQKFMIVDPKKGSVRFETEDKIQMTNGFYLNREYVEKEIKYKKNLDKVKGIEVTVRILE